MARKIHFMGHLPEFYSGIREFEAIGSSIDEEFKLFAKANQEDLANYFVMTANEVGLSVWEKEIGIRADPSAESLDFRRKRLISRYTTRPPFTIKWMDNQLRQLLGDGFIKTARDDAVEILYVYADIDSLSQLNELDTLIETVLPLSMQYGKRLFGFRDIPSCVYVAANSPILLRLKVNPA